MRVRVKICGVVATEDIAAVVDAGADAIGLVFAQSPRQVDLAQARELLRAVPPWLSTVAVFRHPEAADVQRIADELRPHLVQCEPVHGLDRALPAGVGWLPVLHDDEGLDDTLEQVDAQAVLLEAAGCGGRGIAPDWRRAAGLARRRRLILAGGLDPDNVGQAIAQVRPFGIDVSSGVESTRGIKDPGLIRQFLNAVRRAEATLLRTEETQR